MKKVQNSLNYNYKDHEGETFTKPSMTIPDQTMSMREILNRFARGLPVEGARVPMYDPENDLPDINTLDLAERQELKEHYQNELTALRSAGKSRVPENPPVPYEASVDPPAPGSQGSQAT